jgi:RNA polymerase sigma-70 factor (ECF subfamily)
VTDLDLHLDAIAAGDAQAFAAWLAGAEHPLRASLRSFAAAVDAEAVVQESLIRAWTVASKIARDGRPNTLLRWTLRAARNLAISEARRRGRVDLPDDGDLEIQLERLATDGPAPSDPLLRRLIQACLEALPAKPREALLARLAAAGGEADKQTAQRLGVKANTFLQNFTRARKFLAECLASKGVELEGERS